MLTAGVVQSMAVWILLTLSPPYWDQVIPVADRNSIPIAAHTPTEACQENVRRRPLRLKLGWSISFAFRVFTARITHSPRPATAMMPNQEAASSL